MGQTGPNENIVTHRFAGTGVSDAHDIAHQGNISLDSDGPVYDIDEWAAGLGPASEDDRSAWEATMSTSRASWYAGLPSAHQDNLWAHVQDLAAALVSAGWSAP